MYETTKVKVKFVSEIEAETMHEGGIFSVWVKGEKIGTIYPLRCESSGRALGYSIKGKYTVYRHFATLESAAEALVKDRAVSIIAKSED